MFFIMLNLGHEEKENLFIKNKSPKESVKDE